MDRITNENLNCLVKRINEVTGSPMDQFTETVSPDGSKRYKSNPGHYHISGAYGGVELNRICTDGGGATTVSHDGFGSKRQLYQFMTAFLDGYSEAVKI